MKIAAPICLIVFGLAALITLGVAQGGIPEVQVRDVLQGRHADRVVKVHGIIEKIRSDRRPLRFTVVDREDPEIRIEVICDRTRPDTFQETYDVAVQGTHDANRGVFVADRVFTKCPSKYEAKDQARPETAPEPTPGAPPAVE